MASFDTIISGATIVDGTGGAAFAGDIAIAGDRIAAIGGLDGVPARLRIDGGGLAVAPGFIDAHALDDRALLSDPDMAPKASQGVTTVICGNCGMSLSPLSRTDRLPPPVDMLGPAQWFRFATAAAYRQAFEQSPAAINAAFMIGHQTLRLGAMEALDRPADARELRQMVMALEEGMEAGAIGFSTGLEHTSSRAAPTEEVVALARIGARHGGIYATHLRNEADQFIEAVEEAIAIGRQAGLPVVLSHHKAEGVQNQGKVARSLALIDLANRGGEVGLNVYPYAASSTFLDAARAARSTRVLVTWSGAMPEAAGRDLAELAHEHGVDSMTMIARLQPGGATYFSMAEDDVRRVLAYGGTMIGSDGVFHDAHPHPRLWGTFVRVLGRYVREEKLLTLPEAVRRLTGLPARRFGLKDRGELRAGAFADLVLFDAAGVGEAATYMEPKLPATGIMLVLVNGQAIWRDGKATGARPGRMLRRAA